MSKSDQDWALLLKEEGVVEGELDLDLSAGDIASLLSGGLLFDDEADESGEDIEDLLSSSAELHSVTQRITGQYAEVLARYAQALFAGKVAADLPDMVPTLGNLRRLSSSTGQESQVSLLVEFEHIVEAASAVGSAHLRQRQLDLLREWIHRFSQTLTAEDGERLESTVEWQSGSVPLLDELRSIRGIGPKRVARLYRAGLFTVEIVANALPDEVAQATGIPLALAGDVVAASREFADSERRRCAVEMRERAARFKHILQRVVLSEDPEILDIARMALRELESALVGRQGDS